MKGQQQQQQMRGTGFAASSCQQLKQHAYRAAVPSIHSRRRHQVVLAAIGNGNGKPAAAEGEEGEGRYCRCASACTHAWVIAASLDLELHKQVVNWLPPDWI
jgi:hypothetical protein